MRHALIALPLLALFATSPPVDAAPRSDQPSVSEDSAVKLAANRSTRSRSSQTSRSQAKPSSRQSQKQAPVKHAPPPSSARSPAPQQVRPDAARPSAPRAAPARPSGPQASPGRADAPRPAGPGWTGTPPTDPERHDVRPGTPPTGPERHDVRPGTPQAGPERHDARQVGPAGSSAFRPGTPRAGPDRPMGLGDGPVRARRESAGNRIPDARSSRASSPRRPDARYVDRARRVHVHRHTLSSHHRYGVHRTWAWRSRWWWWGPSYVWWHYPVYPWWRPAWTWGVFYDYPSTYAYYPYQGYVDTGDVPSEPQAEAHRQVERAHTFALGVRGGSYLGDYHGSGGFGDFGLGIAARYRAAEALGFELAWQIHDNTWSQDSERITKPFSASVELFAFPWRKVNPYALAGLTWTRRNYEDVLHDVWGEESGDVTRQDTLFGPHFGVGLELGVGSRASLNVEGRAVGYLNVDAEDPTVPSALQGTLGMNLYF